MPYIYFFAMIVLFLIGICGIVGNSMLIWIFNSEGRRSHFNGLSITLAIYDILTILGFFVNAIYSKFILHFCLPWQEGCHLDKVDKNEKDDTLFQRALLLPAIYVVAIGGILTTVALSLERYLTVHQYR